MMRRRVMLALLVAAVACARPRPQTAITRDTPLPNVLLTTQDGARVHFYDDLVKDRVVLINFVFTSCKRYCPRTTANLVRVQRALGDRVGRDVFLVSITLDPAHDSPKVLARYARDMGVGPGWTFLTGDAADIEHLRRSLGVTDPDPAIDADPSQHSGIVVYGNAATGRWSALPGLLEPEQIVRAVLLVAAPAG